MRSRESDEALKPDDLLMWAHYADSHRGFVVSIKEEIPEVRAAGKALVAEGK
jgi:hypothetical protein